MICEVNTIWGGCTVTSDINRLDKLIKKVGLVTGCKQETSEAVPERRTLNKLLSIMGNPSHPLHPLGRQGAPLPKDSQLCCYRDHYRKSFLPRAVSHILLWNSLLKYATLPHDLLSNYTPLALTPRCINISTCDIYVINNVQAT